MYEYGTREWFEQMFSSADSGYDGWGHQWRASQRYRYMLSVSLIRHLLEKKEPQNILDIGCGLGDFTHIVSTVNPLNKLCGMDISQNAVLGASKKYRQIEFRCETLPDIAYADKFAGIIALECVYYLKNDDRKKALDNIFAHLTPRGWLLFSSPLDDGKRYFTREQAIELIQNAGFSISSISYNYAKLHNKFERQIMRFSELSRFLEEIDEYNCTKLSPMKKVLLKATKRRGFGKLLKITIKISALLSDQLLRSITFTKIFQWTSRTFLKTKGRSHIIVMASRDA